MDVFEIVIQRRAGAGWPVVVEYNRSGEFLSNLRREGMLQLDEGAYTELQQTEIDPLVYGTVLGKGLFRESIRDAFVQARTQSAGHLRALLVIEDPQLRSLHWESLCAPIGVAGQWRHLALDQRVLFSLYLPSLTDRRFPAISRRDLRALVVVANPPEYNRFGIAPFDGPATVASVREALGEIPHEVLADVEDADGKPTLEELCSRITDQHYTLLHVVAHGWHREADGETVLYLLDEDSRVSPTPATDLIERLDRLQGARGLPHLAFLSTCESAAPEAEREGALGGLAQRLVRELGMPAVVAMTKRVSIETATALSSRFYERLRAHGEVDRALVESGVKLADAGDITVPALYERLGGRPLFSDAIDRELTDSEIEAGLAELEQLLVVRAPILQTTLAEEAGRVRNLLGADRAMLSREAGQEWDQALDAVNAICEETLDLSFRGLALGQKPPAYDGRCPFPGLAAFQPDEEEFFFGREALVETLLERLKAQRFLALLGPSGSGKSSVVLAGLVPALRKTRPELQLAYVTPGGNPVAQLATRLASLQPGLPGLVFVDQFEELFTLVDNEDWRRAFVDRLLELPEEIPVVITMRADFWGECAAYPDLRKMMQAHQELIGPMSTAELRSAMEQQATAVGLRFEADLSNTILDAVQEEPGAMPLLQHALLEMWYRRHGRWLRSSEYRKIGGVQRAIAETADKIYEQVDEQEQAQMRDIFVRLTRLGEGAGAAERRDTRHRVQFDELVPAGGDPAVTQRLVQRLADARLVVTGINESTGQEEVEVAHEALIRYWPRLRRWLDEDRDLLRLREGIRRAARDWQDSPEDNRDHMLIHRGSRLEEIEELIAEGRLALNEQEQAYVTACIDLRDREARLQEEQRQRELQLARERAAEAEARQKAEEEARQQADQRAQQERKNSRNLRRAAMVVGAVALIAIAAFVLAVIQMGRATRAAAAEERARETAVAEANIRATEVVIRQTAQADAEEKKQQAIAAEATAVAEAERAEAEARRALAESLSAHALTEVEQTVPDPSLALMLASESVHVTRDVDGTVTDNSLRALLEAVAGAPPWRLNLPATRHTDAVIRASFSPEGDRIVSASADGTARVWDATSGQQLLVLDDHAGPVWDAAFSADGNSIVTASMDGTAATWDSRTGEALVSLEGHEGQVWSAAFSPDGSRIATAGEDGTVRMWDARSGAELLTVAAHDDAVLSVAFSPDGSRIATASWDTTAAIWDAEAGTLLTELVHEGPVWDVAFGPDERAVVTASWDGTAILWDASTGSALQVLSHFPEDADYDFVEVLSASFDPSGDTIVTSTALGELFLWDASSGELIDSGLAHVGPIGSAAFGPGGSRIVTASDDTTVKVWDADSGDELLLLGGHGCDVTAANYSPDGNRIVTASCDGSAMIWDAISGNRLYSIVGHEGAISWAAFSPDGRSIVTASEDGTVKLWDAGTGNEQGSFEGHEAAVNSAVFSRDGSQIVTASADGTAKIWNVGSGQEVLELLPAFEDYQLEGALHFADFSPGGERVVTAADDGAVIVWDASSGEPLVGFGHDGAVFTAAFSPDGQRIVTASADRTARVWDAETGEELLVLEEHPNFVRSAAFSPDGDRIVTASDDTTALVWDAETGEKLLSLTGHQDWLTSAAFSPDGEFVVTASRDFTAKVWEVAAGGQIRTLAHDGEEVRLALFSPDSEKVVTVSWEGVAREWDAATGDQLASLQTIGAPVFSAAFAPDGDPILFAEEDEGDTVSVWNGRTGEQLLSLVGHQDYVNSAVLSGDGQRIVTGSQDETARVWDATSGELLHTLSGHEGAVNGVAFSPNGQLIATASEDATAKVWDAQGGRELLSLESHSDSIRHVAFSPDGRRLVTASDDFTAKVWDIASGTAAELLTLKGHLDNVTFVAYSPDGESIITANWDSTAKVWDANTGDEILSLDEHSGPVWSAIFSPDGSRIVTASADGTALVWPNDLDTLLELAEPLIQRNPPIFTPAERRRFGLAGAESASRDGSTSSEDTSAPEAGSAASGTATIAQAPSPTALPPATSTATELPTRAPTGTPTRTPTPEITPTENPTQEATPLITPTATDTPTAAASATMQATLPATSTPTPARLSGRIVFPVFDPNRSVGGQPGGYDIWISDPQGGNRRLLVSNASQPQLNPDGDLLAYRSWDPNERGVALATVEGGGGELLTGFVEDGLPSWAPDSSSIAFVSRREGDRAPRLYRLDPASGNERWLGVLAQYVSTFPDGRLVFKGCSADTSTCGMFITGAEGGQLSPLTDNTSDTAPAPSPDGAQVAFMSLEREGAGNWEIYVVDSSGGEPTRLTRNSAQDGLPAWSPGGETLAFASNRDGAWAIWAMNADGSNERKLFNMGGSPDGVVGFDADNSFGWSEERISWAP